MRSRKLHRNFNRIGVRTFILYGAPPVRSYIDSIRFFRLAPVLVPQLENSLRYVLKQAAIDQFSIQSDMTQENRTISVTLDKEAKALAISPASPALSR